METTKVKRRDRSGHRERAVARGMLGLAAAGLVAVEATWPAAASPDLRAVVLHGLEGALVGGICDAFAVWKTFQAVETSASEVADGIGHFVGAQLLGASVVDSAVRDALARPEAREAVSQALDEWLGTEADLRARLGRYWEQGVPTLAAALAEVDLGDVRGGPGPSFLADPDAVDAVRSCGTAALGALAADDELWGQIRGAVEPIVAGAVPGGFGAGALSAVLLRKVRSRLADQARSTGTPTGQDDTLVRIVERAFAVAGPAYLNGWSALPREQRVRAATALLATVGPPAVDTLVGQAVQARDELQKMEAFSSHPLVRSATASMLPRVAAEISSRTSSVVTGLLRTREGSDLRHVVEANVGQYLQMIRVNGTVLGFVAGAVIGVALLLTG